MYFLVNSPSIISDRDSIENIKNIKKYKKYFIKTTGNSVTLFTLQNTILIKKIFIKNIKNSFISLNKIIVITDKILIFSLDFTLLFTINIDSNYALACAQHLIITHSSPNDSVLSLFNWEGKALNTFSLNSLYFIINPCPFVQVTCNYSDSLFAWLLSDGRVYLCAFDNQWSGSCCYGSDDSPFIEACFVHFNNIYSLLCIGDKLYYSLYLHEAKSFFCRKNTEKLFCYLYDCFTFFSRFVKIKHWSETKSCKPQAKLVLPKNLLLYPLKC
jgi:hypothetical protein